jgi:hypothetical protein
MTTYTGRGTLTAVLRVKLSEVFYVPRVRQWFSIIRSQADASGVAGLGYPEGSLPTEGKLVGTLSSEHPAKN